MKVNRLIIYVLYSRGSVQRCQHHQRSTDPNTAGKPKVVTMLTLSSPVAAEVVVMTTSGAASDDKVGIMTTLAFQCD